LAWIFSAAPISRDGDRRASDAERWESVYSAGIKWALIVAIPRGTRVEVAVRDQRRHARKKVSIEAHLFLRGEKSRVIPCKVLDISEGGARVKTAVPCSLPSEVFLVKDEAEIIYECETVWQKRNTAGLMFLDLCARAKLQGVLDDMWGAPDP
jgi:hypothetical protein